MFRVVVILLLGSLAAPAIYVAVGFVFPAGFHDLRGTSLSATAVVFAIAWLFSFALTLGVGGSFWGFLHSRGADGLLSYCVLATVACAVLMGAISGGDFAAGSFRVGAGLAVGNAILVRTIERSYPSRAPGHRSSPGQRLPPGPDQRSSS